MRRGDTKKNPIEFQGILAEQKAYELEKSRADEIKTSEISYSEEDTYDF